MVQFGNIVTAMVTPFDQKGNLDLVKTTELVNYLLDNGTDALVVAGTTGESPTLTAEEKVALFRHVVSVVNGRALVIAGTGTNDTRASIELTKRAEEAGVDAVMLVAPYYNKPNQEGLYQHFKAIAESTPLPVMLYNVPGRTSVNLAPETVIRLAAIPNIVAVKEAGGNLEAMAEIIERTPDDFLLYSGDDSLTLPVLAIGGAGVVSVASHIIGNEMQQMIRVFQAGDHKGAAALHRKWLPLMKGLFAAPSPVPVKTALQLRGLDVGPVRLPLVPLTEQERNELSRLLSALS
ncbi:4-hydroxy-tetrahydrodipicolinate synthase [Geobacillus subterraneus]|uniref:4-hydroxy-tetrahydrodipicolinate synthase n=2 Tax=Geobacillus TaxID=129337 RepID=A0ABM6ACH8_9BACL|nr:MULTISPECIES: 4-hydroxy-tetrahydrodipicolinate synthase [Geobacillus]AMX83986.1 4-hydroxy-tetrahydrodipicolinate synthase [Geobacillus subterraneus]KZS26778.1 4-hydroxy-tetrahydrodipicolinate synthase [Geobacillus subterraneus]OXB88192.1 4-hydroxy-tetrahydrodipicolinate synthase [Geobacillus uzenensis]QIZ67379.1 4-hydroxy-tetrahydrodipicolinate synthase [Geobacillus subterraneus]